MLAGCSREPASLESNEATQAASPEKNLPEVAPNKIDLVHPVVAIDTSEGAIIVRLDAENAPGTVRNFLDYVNEGFYSNTLIHYVVPRSMIVAGGYATDRSPKPTRPAIRNEAHNGLKNSRGTIAMARDSTLIDGATSQFFINLADAPQRDHKGDTADDYGYCVFGQVTDGLDVADKIAALPTTNLGNDLSQTPNPAVVIKSIRVLK
jgi:cyclophilin family peptidyl-prolyl cis-trans isomerase